VVRKVSARDVYSLSFPFFVGANDLFFGWTSSFIFKEQNSHTRFFLTLAFINNRFHLITVPHAYDEAFFSLNFLEISETRI
jgi:hypothetical protein